ncbi:hypothetical protein [Agrobacterium sp. NPDC090283]|uniref:hypothetical protein n=1 Tax=Agrobacterium sp. NPDC090283 TaxID=3363920 RepID=UPI00383A3BA8
MSATQLTPEDELQLLYEEAKWLEETLASCDRDMASAIQAHKDGLSLRDDIFADLQDRATTKAELSFKRGQLSAQIEQREELVRAQERQRAEEQQNRATLSVLDNHLDWLDIEVRPLPAPSHDELWQEPER